MQAQCFARDIPAEQGVGTEGRNRFMEGQRIVSNRLQVQSKMLCASHYHLFRDGIGSQKRTEPEQICGGGVLLFYVLKGE